MLLYVPHFNLQSLNTLAVPAVADLYVAVHSLDELREAIAYLRDLNLPILVLGGGSNIVLRDNFPGGVIHIKSKGVELVKSDENFYWVQAQAGEIWQDFVEYCLDQEYWGLENLSLIPGTVGAAPVQNIGAYGVELKDVFAELSALDIKSGVVVTFTLDSCQFGYRDSIFKQAFKDQFIILSVTFKLSRKPNLHLEYPGLQAALADYEAEEITPLEVAEAVCAVRRSKLPDPKDIPNVGSFFHNPIVSQDHFQELKLRYPDMVAYSVENGVKLAAGWLIDKAGWKGFIGEVSVHKQQALVITNPNRALGKKVLDLADSIRKDIYAKFGVELSIEPRIFPE